VSEGRFEKGGEAADRAYRPGQETGEVREIPVIAGNVRWERPTTRSFWNALADPEREALAAAGVEQIFRAGSVLCREGDESSQVMIIDSGWVKVSVKVNAGAEAREEILAIRGQGDVVGERAALTTQVRSATVTALDEVSAMVVPAERFAEFLRGHPRAAEVLQRQIIERREEDRTRLSLGEPAGAERRLAWLLLDLARRRGGYQQVSSAMFTLPVSQQELADWAGTSLDTVGRFLRSWRERGIIARSDRARRLTVVDLDGLAAMCGAAPAAQPGTAISRAVTGQLLAEDMGELYPEPGEARTRPVELEAREVLGLSGTPAVADRPVADRPLADRPVAAASAEIGHAQGGTQRPGAVRYVPAWLELSGEPLNCSVLFTDVAGFGDPKRNDGDREAVRKALYEISQSALEASGVPWAECYYEDRGDGTVIVVPPTIATVRVVDPLIPELASRLRQYNRRAGDVVQIQLRAALHVGPVGRDAEGLTGEAIIVAARILDVPVLKARLAADQADLMFAASDYVYDHVIRHCVGRVDSATFEHVDYQVKKLRISAWVHLAGGAAAQPRPGSPLDGKLATSPGTGADPLGTGPPPAPEGWTAPRPVAAPLGRLPAEVRGRDGLLDELRRALRPYPWRASRAFVIAGMGGLGKSTIALEATRMAKARGYRVWWIGAADTALLTGGMLEVLRELRAPESVMAPVREGAPTAPARAWEFLNGEHLAGRRWLLVFDGADNPAVLAGADATTPADGTGWLRADPSGMVVVTTRNRDPQVWGTRIILRELKPLDDAAGAEVLRDLAPDVADPAGYEARELSRRLGGLPLALHLAGAYLGSPFARWSSFAAYHGALDSVELPAALDDIEGPGADTRATLQRTWDLSLDALAAEGRPQARQLLLVLSCFAPATPIPARLLQPQPLADLLASHASTAGDHHERLRRLREGWQGLSHTGLIEVSGSGPAGLNAVTMHPVVADVNRRRLSALPAADRTAVQATAAALLEAAAAGLDAARPSDWPAWRLLFPHVNAAVDLLAADLDPGVLARLLTVSAACTDALLGGGRRVAAEKLAQASVVAAASLSREHPAAMTARGSLALTLVRRGRIGEAEMLYRDLLADRRQVQGDDHHDTLATRHDLAAAIGLQGRYGEAEQLYRRLLHDDYRLLGPDHRHTLAARHNLARMTGRQGRYAEAEELCKEVLDDQRRLLGETHPGTLATRHSLARITGMAGRYAEAEQMYRQVLDERRRVLGNDHPDTLSTRHRLARMIGQQGRYAEAEELCREVLEDRRRLLGDDHPDNLATRHRLARMLGLQGRYADAEPLFRQVLAARRRTLGDDHPDTLATGHRLAWLIGRQGRYAEAMEMASQVLGGRRHILGDDHPDTLDARETLAWLTGLRGKLGEADELCRDVLAARQRVLGPCHPDTLTTRASLARLTAQKGRYPEAERQYREVLADRQDVLGPGHPDTLTTRQDVARMIGRQGRPAEAEQMTRDVLADRRRVLGDDHPDTLTSRAILAWLAARQGRLGEAEELYRQLLADRNRVLGASHPDTETTRNELAQLITSRTGTDA
jgi:CRP-like cAMP-binding protein/tetratricopeptide (TPR) repeat protein